MPGQGRKKTENGKEKEKGERRGRGRGSRDLDEKSRDLCVGWRVWNRKRKKNRRVAARCKGVGGKEPGGNPRV